MVIHTKAVPAMTRAEVLGRSLSIVETDADARIAADRAADRAATAVTRTPERRRTLRRRRRRSVLRNSPEVGTAPGLLLAE